MNLEQLRERMKYDADKAKFEAVIEKRFTPEQTEQIKEAALARAHRSIEPNSTVYLDGMLKAVVMSNNSKSFEDIISALSETKS